MRKAEVMRKTKETEIYLTLNLDGEGKSTLRSGVGFLDHMLTLFAFHGGFDLSLQCMGDLEVDDHHTVEDIGLALGQAIIEALGDKRGVNRYGQFYLPMDETLARAVLDISGRPHLHYEGRLTREKVGDFSTENVKEFFKAVVSEARITLHLEVLYGENDHHKIEALFKAFARACREAVAVTGAEIPSTKGVL